LSDPADRKRVDGVFMLPVQVIGPSGVLVDSDVTFTGRPEYANAYPEHFDAQLAALAREGVPAERVLADVRLAKRFFKDVLGSYKAWQGGPSGVGVEQMVLQSGGTFDGMMAKVYAAAYRPDGVARGLKQARRAWTVENRFMAPANFLDLFGDKAWAKTAYAAKAYREARAAGAALTFDDLRAPAPAPTPAVPVKKETPVTAFVASDGYDARITVASYVTGAALDKLTKRLSRRLRFGRARPARAGKGVVTFDFRLDGADPKAFVAAAKAFFEKPNGGHLLEVAVPAAPAAAPVADTAGARTLDMLTRFTQHGPAPAARGDAYLYAQGAKALPAGLEAPRPAAAPLTAPQNGSVVRTKFFRRGGRAYVMLDDPEAEGPNTQRPVKVPAKFAQGIVTDTLVEVAASGKFITALRPIGSYAADVVIGRVVKVGNSLLLGPLFTGDSAKALYEPLALSETAKEGDILQAFVRKTPGGYEAVPLIALGTQLTPEIAAREIALRHGARGYFERAVIEQAEEVGRTQDPEADFKRMKESKGRAEDLRALPFVTIDPVGAGDLDDAYYVSKEADGSWTWYLATADVAQYVRPGTPAFRAAARIGNTFYSVDKDGVPEYPMNHPVVSKSVSSLLAGKDSLAMVTKMRFSPEGKFLLEDSEVYLGLVRVQGRYTYDQVAALWRGAKDHGIAHPEQVSLARELAAKLGKADDARGKLALSFTETRHVKGPDGRWRTEIVEDDPLEHESHRLIEELKVYGNRAIATRLEAVADAAKAPHISRVHPHQEEKVDERLRKQLSSIGVPWRDDETLWNYLARLKSAGSVRPEVRETAQLLALMSRASALYAADDAEGHEGLALDAKAYDHPSTPIRRFSDMYNRALLEAHLEGGDAKAVHEAVLADLKALGFADFEEYLAHLNGREQAARRMDREFDGFMSVYELA
ncbi:MAG: ribonuclease R, partial [Elusimicrobia bacterium]